LRRPAVNVTRKSAVLFDPSAGWLDTAADALAESGIAPVHRARRLTEAVALVEWNEPGLLVADAAGEGLELIRQARSHVPALKAIAVGALWDEEVVTQAFEAGASAFLISTERFDTFGVAAREPAADPLVVEARETSAA
jgi:DNA-binding NarL/FixJ family response regulator